jgi:EF-P beta-lysylation protein EpmB
MTVFPQPKKDSQPLWRQVQRENFSRFEPLADFLGLSLDLKKKILQKSRFSLNVPRRLANKIAKNTLDDPILRQFVPLEEELLPFPDFVPDPVQDEMFRQTKKIIHKYKGRALILASSACAMHCRFCFRQNFPYETEEKGFEEELNYIRGDESLIEIILSGGDPLSLSESSLANLFQSLEKIPHLKRIRFHSRFPIGIPERIDSSFLELLSSCSKQIFFVIHCNHPKELDSDVVKALKKIQYLAIPVLNQSTLLKGVNDDEKTLLDLSETLLETGISPYYLHELDQVEGAGHFAVPRGRSQELVRYLQANLSGFGVPRLVREISGQASKTFINT